MGAGFKPRDQLSERPFSELPGTEAALLLLSPFAGGGVQANVDDVRPGAAPALVEGFVLRRFQSPSRQLSSTSTISTERGLTFTAQWCLLPSALALSAAYAARIRLVARRRGGHRRSVERLDLPASRYLSRPRLWPRA